MLKNIRLTAATFSVTLAVVSNVAICAAILYARYRRNKKSLQDDASSSSGYSDGSAGGHDTDCQDSDDEEEDYFSDADIWYEITPRSEKHCELPSQEDLVFFFTKAIEEYRSVVINGDPKLGIPVQEPFQAVDFNYSDQISFANLNVYLEEIICQGASLYTLESLSVCRESGEISVVIGNLLQTGKGFGTLKATVMGLPYWHKSGILIKFKNVKATISGKFQATPNGNLLGGKMSVKTTEDDVKITLVFELGNQVVNRILDMQKVYNSYRVVVEEQLCDIYYTYIFNCCARYQEKMAKWRNINN